MLKSLVDAEKFLQRKSQLLISSDMSVINVERCQWWWSAPCDSNQKKLPAKKGGNFPSEYYGPLTFVLKIGRFLKLAYTLDECCLSPTISGRLGDHLMCMGVFHLTPDGDVGENKD